MNVHETESIKYLTNNHSNNDTCLSSMKNIIVNTFVILCFSFVFHKIGIFIMSGQPGKIICFMQIVKQNVWNFVPDLHKYHLPQC